MSGMNDFFEEFLTCDNCPCIYNKVYQYTEVKFGYMILCKKCKDLIRGDYECTLNEIESVMRNLPTDKERKNNVKKAIEERDRCREARAMNKKRDEALERRECLIED